MEDFEVIGDEMHVVDTEPTTDDTTAPKKRTRRKRDENGNFPDEPIPVDGTTAPKKRKKRKAEFDVAQSGFQVLMLNSMAVSFFRAPELEISEKEAENIARAGNAFAEEFGLEMTGKVAVSVVLITTLIGVYAPKVMALKGRIDHERLADNPDTGA